MWAEGINERRHLGKKKRVRGGRKKWLARFFVFFLLLVQGVGLARRLPAWRWRLVGAVAAAERRIFVFVYI